MWSSRETLKKTHKQVKIYNTTNMSTHTNKRNNLIKVKKLVEIFETYRYDYISLQQHTAPQTFNPIYWSTHFGTIDKEEAKIHNPAIIDWLETRATRGIFGAQKLLAYCYYREIFTRRDHEKAIKYFTMAGHSDDYDSQVILANMYVIMSQEGNITPKDKRDYKDNIIFWYIKAIENKYHETTTIVNERQRLIDYVCNRYTAWTHDKDYIYDIIHKYNDHRKLSNEVSELKQENDLLKEKVAKLEKDLKKQIEEAYAPLGIGYHTHKKHFDDTAGKIKSLDDN